MKKEAVLFISLLALNLFAAEKSTQQKGIAMYQNDEIMVTMALINDFNRFIAEWQTAASKKPKIETALSVRPGQTLIPIILYSVRNPKTNFPVYCDADFIMPDGSFSEQDRALNIKIIEKPKGSNALFLIDNLFGFSITGAYKKGVYTVRVRIYTDKKEICVLESKIAVENE